LLALLGARHILHVSRIRVNSSTNITASSRESTINCNVYKEIYYTSGISIEEGIIVIKTRIKLRPDKERRRSTLPYLIVPNWRNHSRERRETVIETT
jgi:hypothetical protein